MLKIVSWLLIIVAMGWTWELTYSESAIGMDIHAKIQREVGEIIRDYIKEKRPTVREVRFQKLYTQVVDQQSIRAVFKYTYQDSLPDQETTDQVFEGQALLKKDENSTDEESIWILREVKADKQSILFQKGSEIRPEEKGETPRPAGPSSGEQQNG